MLAVRGEERDFEIAEHLAAFAEVARQSREYQGDGWGCAWLDGGGWRLRHSVLPIWEDRNRPRGRTRLLLAHARSAFEGRDVRVENNMPFFDGERVFLFNGELRGVRIRERGRIGAEKVFHFVKRFDRGDPGLALEQALPRIEARARRVRAMNIILADASFRVFVASRFREDPDYFGMHRATVGGAEVICSEPYRDRPAKWTPVGNGALLRF